MALVGLPPGKMSLPIFNMVLKASPCAVPSPESPGLEEALAFAGSGAVSAHFSWDKLENINDIFARMEDGKIDGRIVVDLQ
jgi:propanol-preferring alcohol dehydrogenase